jgi:serine phosphatase RsbU (regulator of sigma subunit)
VGLRSGEARDLLRRLGSARVEVLGDLASARLALGLIALSGKSGQLSYEPEELRLLRGLLNQASIALETHRLLEERTRQAELERELEIAAGIQSSLLPGALELAPGWRVAAACVPARHVGGDFITKLPGPTAGSQALAYGDVSGKSVSGALVMMAAYEILGSLAMTTPDPVDLVELANQRLYRLGKLGRKGFVALGYFAVSPEGEALSYLLAGQPPPLRRDLEGRVSSLTLPRHRLPLGGLATGGYQLLSVPLRPGEIILGYSDGILEAHSPQGELFGAERLGKILEKCPSDPESVVRQVLDSVSSFTGGSEPYDDLTLLALRRETERSR